MKKMMLVCLFSFFLLCSQGQVLFTYGNHSVTTTEFLKAFDKNKNDSNNDKTALKNYLDLYINFKLKVQAAKDMHIDTLTSMKADVQNFRLQIQNNYLTDQKEIKDLTNQAFVRSQKDIHVIYYFLKILENKDSAKANERIKKAIEESKTGKESDLITGLKSSGLFSIETGDFGFITVFDLPYQFENIVYGLKPGIESAPVPVKNGWYIFKNENERKAVGKITVAQILFSIPDGASTVRGQIKNLADSIYAVLKNGGDFAALAKEFSDDRSTFMNGGLMAAFGTAKYDPEFEAHAFALKEDGDISAPFETKYGYHIVKRISATPIPADKKDETYLFDLKQQVLKDSRSEIAQQKFIKEILPQIGYKNNPNDEKKLWDTTDSLLLDSKFGSSQIATTTVIFSFNDGTKMKVNDWIAYLRHNHGYQNTNNNEDYKKVFKDFSNISALSDYASRLDHFDPEFKAQVDEFKEGNMLFDIMQKKVWQEATNDSAGLKNYYQQHKEKYVWNRSADAILFSCSSLAVAKNAMAQLKKRIPWREIVNDDQNNIQADSARFDLGQIPVVDRTNFTDGLITAPVVNKNDRSATFAKIIKIYPANEPRKFEDARGLAINDYQNFLEENWIMELKKKYPVKVNNSVFQKLLSQFSK